MGPPHNRSIPTLAREEGISTGTLYNWRNKARASGRLMPDNENTPEGWTSRDKFAAVLETASLNEAELGEYCRRRGLLPEQIRAWRAACESANDWDKESRRQSAEAARTEKARVRQLERDLARKEKALAETAALLVLRKNRSWPPRRPSEGEKQSGILTTRRGHEPLAFWWRRPREKTWFGDACGSACGDALGRSRLGN